MTPSLRRFSAFFPSCNKASIFFDVAVASCVAYISGSVSNGLDESPSFVGRLLLTMVKWLGGGGDDQVQAQKLEVSLFESLSLW